jgi:hypothetical protein
VDTMPAHPTFPADRRTALVAVSNTMAGNSTSPDSTRRNSTMPVLPILPFLASMRSGLKCEACYDPARIGHFARRLEARGRLRSQSDGISTHGASSECGVQQVSLAFGRRYGPRYKGLDFSGCQRYHADPHHGAFQETSFLGNCESSMMMRAE